MRGVSASGLSAASESSHSRGTSLRSLAGRAAKLVPFVATGLLDRAGMRGAKEAFAETRVTTWSQLQDRLFEGQGRHLLRNFRKFARPTEVPGDSIWNWLWLDRYYTPRGQRRI